MCPTIFLVRGRTRQHCCTPRGHVSKDCQKQFFCRQETKLVSATNVAHVEKRVNIWETWSCQQCCCHNLSPRFVGPVFAILKLLSNYDSTNSGFPRFLYDSASFDFHAHYLELHLMISVLLLRQVNRPSQITDNDLLKLTIGETSELGTKVRDGDIQAATQLALAAISLTEPANDTESSAVNTKVRSSPRMLTFLSSPAPPRLK